MNCTESGQDWTLGNSPWIWSQEGTVVIYMFVVSSFRQGWAKSVIKSSVLSLTLPVVVNHTMLEVAWYYMVFYKKMHLLFCLLCSQSWDPLQSLHIFVYLLWPQMEDPLHSLQSCLYLLCSQKSEPPQCLHLVFCLSCSQISDPLHSTHLPLGFLCSHVCPNA